MKYIRWMIILAVTIEQGAVTQPIQYPVGQCMEWNAGLETFCSAYV